MKHSHRWYLASLVAVAALLAVAVGHGPLGSGSGRRVASPHRVRSTPAHDPAGTGGRPPARTTSAYPSGGQREPAASAPVRTMQKDVAISPTLTSTPAWESLLQLAKQGGATIVSTTVNWEAFEPDGPDPPAEWNVLDAFVDQAHLLGMQVRFQLAGLPDWARAPGSPDYATQSWRVPTTPAELGLWQAFVRRVAVHFAGRVRYYEIWNEPNIWGFFQPWPNPGEYAALLEASYTTIKSVDPSAEVMFAGLSRNDVGFLQQTYSAIDRLFPGTAVTDHHFFDILGANPYAGDRSPAEASVAFDHQGEFGLMDENFLGFGLLHQVMVQNGEGEKRIYITEYGLSTAGWNDFPAVSDQTRAQYLQLAFNLARHAGYIMAFSWYCLYPTPYNSWDWAMLQGNYPDWQPTLTFKAWAAEPG